MAKKFQKDDKKTKIKNSYKNSRQKTLSANSIAEIKKERDFTRCGP